MPVTPSSDRVSQLLQQAIASRALVPGDRVGTEAELARELHVSRPAVREAVRLLVRANLLRAARGPGGGVFVARSPDRGLARTVSEAIGGMLATNTTSLPELTEVRLLLEVPLAGLAAEHAGPETIAELWRTVEDATARPDDDLVQRESDVHFHQTIAEAAGNRVASALSAWCSEVLQPRLKDLIAPAIVEAVAREQHREIIVAIEQRKPVLAERAMRVHLRYLNDLLETVGPPAARTPASEPVANYV
jgi:GntR family transcriptional regulator, transcriptional repressor for pyruvate dehydrogenase complex